MQIANANICMYIYLFIYHVFTNLTEKESTCIELNNKIVLNSGQI